ncbi:MAG TPA: HAD hydrolase family protein [Candidatus Krumholzibacteria bacterium]|nr:HAD hydrolase family protein [Candidatus Krumholzibacteria bacterium]
MQARPQRLVAVDVDGTLLNTEFDDVLGRREIAAIEACRAAGHTVALCTGRNLPSVTSLLESSSWFPDDLPLVLLNGAVVLAGTPRREIACHVLDGPVVERLVALYREHGTVPMVYGLDSDGGLLHHESRPVNDVLGRYLEGRRTRVGRIEAVDDLLARPWARALEVGTIDRREPIEALTAAVHRELGASVAVVNTRSLLGEGAFWWAEAFRRGTGKGSGVRDLAGALGLELDQAVAMGDNYNDLDMFAACGTSVAMAGSPDEVLAAADHVAGPVADGGAAAVLEAIAAGTFPPAGDRRGQELEP